MILNDPQERRKSGEETKSTSNLRQPLLLRCQSSSSYSNPGNTRPTMSVPGSAHGLQRNKGSNVTKADSNRTDVVPPQTVPDYAFADLDDAVLIHTLQLSRFKVGCSSSQGTLGTMH